MLEHLFGSKTRLKLLRLFFRDPTRAYYVRELTRSLDSQVNAIRREIQLLLRAGIVKEKEGAVEAKPGYLPEAGENLRRYYILNKESIVYPELQALLAKAQLLGEEQFIKDVQARGGHVSLFLLTGCFTQDKRAPTDVLLVGTLHARVIEKTIESYEKEFGCPIR
ncbi:MAG: hypothetical protein HY984_02390, partial [Candidatus Magasanikbacteria bacterium]|nr:hypothetical protein [Candidatus Magasanikbacteria bacterium]